MSTITFSGFVANLFPESTFFTWRKIDKSQLYASYIAFIRYDSFDGLSSSQ